MTLANNPDQDVFNGEQFTVLESRLRGEYCGVTVETDSGDQRQLLLLACGFEGPDGEDKAKLRGRRGAGAATFAHAVTVHKAQGSQWDSVLVLDESYVFGANARRWFYTALTRAAQRVIVKDY
jgi:exodeoxyribonuclease-5